MSFKGILVTGILTLSTLGIGFAVADSSTVGGTTQITLEPIEPGPDPVDDGPETVDTDDVALAYFTGLAEEAPAPDDCAPQWQALILAKDNWNKTAIGVTLAGWIAPPVAAGVLFQKTGALIDARKLMKACCAVGNRAKQYSCKEAAYFKYFK